MIAAKPKRFYLLTRRIIKNNFFSQSIPFHSTILFLIQLVLLIQKQLKLTLLNKRENTFNLISIDLEWFKKCEL